MVKLAYIQLLDQSSAQEANCARSPYDRKAPLLMGAEMPLELISKIDRATSVVTKVIMQERMMRDPSSSSIATSWAVVSNSRGRMDESKVTGV